jgi:HEAT repeat protein
MKRFFSALALCGSLLVVMSVWFYRAEAAKEDAILTLLNLPAPPPPNPLVKPPAGARPPEFYDRQQPPPDNAPIEDLMDYWARMSLGYADLNYNPRPSATVANRIMRELQDDPEKIVEYLNIFQGDRRAEDMARGLYQRLDASGDDEDSGRIETLKSWLKTNTDDFSGELEAVASRIRDANEYVENQDALLSLTRVNWDKAEPIVTRMYNDKSQKATQVLATWAMYVRAKESGGIDVDKYRDELKAVVENKDASGGMRDLALDALVKDGEWPGRDDWYISLLEDETLSDPRVNGRSYTGLTTIMYHIADDSLTERMISLMSSDNVWVRTAAAKNLLIRMGKLTDSPKNDALRRQMVESMLPWLTKKDWIKADSSQRSALVRSLQSVKMPEAVPALIEALNAKESMSTLPYANVANAANTAANAISAAANSGAFTANGSGYNAAIAAAKAAGIYGDREYFPLRSAAITALGNQQDMRAVAPLRRVLIEAQEWERTAIVKALLDCNGFSTEEQVAAIEYMARSAGDIDKVLNDDERAANYSGSVKDRALFTLRYAIAEKGTRVAPAKEEIEEADKEFDGYRPPTDYTPEATAASQYDQLVPPERPTLTEESLKFLVASQLVSLDDPDESLVRATVDRIAALDPREPMVANALRKVILGWNGAAFNSLIMRDTRAGKFDVDAILKLLANRKELREKQMSDVADMRGGVPAAKAIAACLLEDKGDYDSILTTGPDAAKIALFACARLIRAELPLDKVVPNLKSPNKMMAMASERYLESEDSHEARAAILAAYPNQAKILGATTVFNVPGLEATPGVFLRDVFASVNPYFGAEEYAYLPFMQTGETEIEKRLQNEVRTKPDLLGVYSFDKQFVRIYADRAVFSWEDDPARYRERTLEPQQFESLKAYFTVSRVEDLPPFLACSSGCESKQLLMIGKSGGRRVFVKSDTKLPQFFANLQGFFDEMKKQPSKLKYYAGEQAPGLDVLLDDKDLSAMSVWKSGTDLRVLITDGPRERAIVREVDRQSEAESAQLQAEEKSTDGIYQKYNDIREARRYEASAWFRIADGKLGEKVSQPLGAEYVPANDGLVPAAEFGQWSAKTARFEIRADTAGLYKVANGRSVRIRQGSYSMPVVTTNGRWVIASKYNDESGSQLVRINLANNREYRIGAEDQYLSKAICYIPSRNLVLVSGADEEDEHGEYDDSRHVSAYETGRGYSFLNPDTGAVVPAIGEVRPLAHQTFRSLQPVAGSTTEFWAALPRGKAGTLFGIYSTRNFSFKPVLRLPKIIFDSVEMWVDEGEKKVYFIHEGHLLSAPYSIATERPR